MTGERDSFLETGKPVVSVCVITYNHGPYIRQALDGVLSQQTEFSFEICIGEDESSDGTREICQEYAAKFPNIIRLFLRSRKDVIFINGKATGRFNFVETINACRGKYIALLEGDDYWTDPLKLQKQYRIMEENPEACGSFHLAKIEENNTLREWFWRFEGGNTFPFKDIYLYGNFVPTCSQFIKKHSIDVSVELFTDLSCADWPLQLYLSRDGKNFVFLDEYCAVYRKHATGSWNNLEPLEQVKRELEVAMKMYFKLEEITTYLFAGRSLRGLRKLLRSGGIGRLEKIKTIFIFIGQLPVKVAVWVFILSAERMIHGLVSGIRIKLRNVS